MLEGASHVLVVPGGQARYAADGLRMRLLLSSFSRRAAAEMYFRRARHGASGQLGLRCNQILVIGSTYLFSC